MTVNRRPRTLSAAVYLLSTECFVFAVLIGIFVYRTVNNVAGFDAYFGDTPAKRTAALTEAIVIGALLVIAVVFILVTVPGLLRGEAWSRICLITVAGGLVVYPTFLTIRALFDPLYIDWMKIGFTLLGVAGATTAIGLLLSPSVGRFIEQHNP